MASGYANARIRGRIETKPPEEQVAERTEEREDEDVGTDEDLDDLEPTPEDLEDAASTTDPAGADVESIHEVLEKQEARDDEDEADEEEPVVAVAATKGEERLEPIEARVVPIQSTEFVCKNCFLVKHRSQLADKRRMFCRDCA
jgi:Domain of unknown function (DUF4193)